MTITLFGKGQPTQEEYDMAYNLGKRIALKGFVLKNGAYGGTMEASAKGASEHNGHVIGVGVKGHKIDKLGRPNEFNSQVIVKDTRHERIQELKNADMIIVLPGQIGTLEEMFSTWIDYIQSDKKPIFVLGEKMINLMDFLEDNEYIKKHQFSHIKKVRTIDEIDFIN